MFPGTFTKTVKHPTESLFIPVRVPTNLIPFHRCSNTFLQAFFLSISTILSCIQEYGVPFAGSWLLVAVRILFWIYTAITFITAVLQYHLLFTGKPLTLQSMTPAWIMPVFPVMLSGTLAASIAGSQPPHHAIPIIIAGTTFQGLGILVAILFYSNYVGRLMMEGLPSPKTRPGMFISVGPPAFTGLAYIGMADAAIEVFPHTFVVGTEDVPTAQVLKIVAVFLAICFWTLSLFFFCISFVAVSLELGHTKFHLTWWSLIFPNVGFIVAMIQIGTAINSPAILWVSSVCTVVLVVVYLCVLFAHVRAVLKKEILWPGRDEDHFS